MLDETTEHQEVHNMVRMIWIVLLAVAISGCAEMSVATYQVGMHRYAGGEPGHPGAHARGLAYQTCTATDNSSYEALDACMAKSGYSRKDK
jgi:hypothetical protein